MSVPPACFCLGLVCVWLCVLCFLFIVLDGPAVIYLERKKKKDGVLVNLMHARIVVDGPALRNLERKKMYL